MEALPKELKKIIQLTTDSLKSFEYIIMVMDERIKVEEHYLNGLNKIQGQFNYIKENDPLAFECSALKVDISQRANHNQYLIEQMKAEQDEMKLLLKKTQEKVKETDNNFKESEKIFKQKSFDLEKQKERLIALNKEVEDMSLFYQLIETDVQKGNPKWKDKRSTIVTKFKISLKTKEELEANYRSEVKIMESYVEEYNKQLISKYDELVIQSNDLRNTIHDLARKQLVFEVNQIRNVQYDLDNVIKQVDSRPSFAFQPEKVTIKLNPHKELHFLSFFTPFSGETVKKVQELPLDLDQSMSLSVSTQLPGMDSNFDCISKEERSSIQAYFQKGLIDNLNQLSIIKNKKLKDSCHYLMNSVIQAKGDSVDVDIINLDISIILNEIQVRTQKNRQAYLESLSQSQENQEGKQANQQDKQDDSTILKDESINQSTNGNLTQDTQKLVENNENEEGKKVEIEQENLIEEKSEGQSKQEVKEIVEEKPEAKQDQTENKQELNEGERKQEEGQSPQQEQKETTDPVVEQTDKVEQKQEAEEQKEVEEKDKQQEQQDSSKLAENTQPNEENKKIENEQPSAEEKEKTLDNEKTVEIEKSLENEKPIENEKPLENEKSLENEKQEEKSSEKQEISKPVEQQKIIEQEEQEIITDIAPVFFDYSNEQNQAIFLIFLECFRQSGKSQISPQQNNQLVIECFRYLDDLFLKKDILQLIKFMPLTFAIYRLTAAEKVFIQDKIKHHFIWTNNDVWESLIFRSIKDELNKLDPSIADDESVYRNTVYSNLATIGLNMLKFRSTKQNTKNLLAKLSLYYGLPDQQSSELVNFIENEGQNEKSLSFVKTSGYNAKANMTKGRIITFGQSMQQQQQQQQQQPAQAPTNTAGTTFQETKVNPLLQKHVQTTQNTTSQPPRQFQSTFTPNTNTQQIPKPLGGGQINPMLSQQQPQRHTTEYKPQNLLGQEMNNVVPSPNNSNSQEGNANKSAINPNQPIPQFANQQVPIQIQQQKSNINLPANKVNSKLFGSGQNFALNNKNL